MNNGICRAARVAACAIVAMLVAQVVEGTAATAAEMTPRLDPKAMIPLVHGPNWVDLNGDGKKDLVVKSRVTANGPLSYSIYTFHVFAEAGAFTPGTEKVELLEPQIHWYTVLFPDLSPPWGERSIGTFQGADCILRDYRLLVSSGSGALLVEARRDRGESDSDPANVTFSVYRLEKGSEKALNEFAFLKVNEFRARKKYCSVVNAFKDELGLVEGDPAMAGYDYEP